MRTLNRPMFRYGGPIKEGVMSGIREPKKDGGMLLVGEHPKEFKDAGGREKHLAPIVYGAGLGLARLAPLAMRAGRAIKGIFGSTRPFQGPIGSATKVPGKFSRASNVRIPSSGTYSGVKYTPGGSIPSASGTKLGEGFVPSTVGRYLINSPEGRLIAGSTGLAGKVGRGVYKGGKYLASSPITVAGGLIYAGGKFFNKDGTPASADAIAKSKASEGGPPGGGETRFGNQEAVYDAPQANTGTDMSTKSAEELRKDRVQRYRDIMDIKGMNKTAAYNSLIAASQLINQEGDFKGSIKDGSLISKLIGATSKAFDKPSQTKDAIDTLILKGEIEKDIKASDPAAKLAAELTQKRIDLAEKQLAGDSLEDTVNAIFAKTGAFPSGSGLASVARTKGIDVKDVAKTEDINNFLKANPGKNEIDFMESQVQITIEKGQPITPGAYVVKDRIIVIDSEGNVSPYL